MTVTLQFISFTVNKNLYGLDIRVVKEISTNTDITPVPLTPGHVRGLVNIRGQVVLVLDIDVIFGRDQRPITPESRTVILKTAPELKKVRGLDQDFDSKPFGDKPIAFLIDNIGDVVSVDERAIEPPPPHLEQAKADHLGGVVRLGERVQMILDAAQILGRD